MVGKLAGWIGFAAVFSLAGCSPSSAQQVGLARTAEIDRTAPIVADQSIAIDASDATIWRLIVGIDQWPKWQPKIKDAKVHGAVAVGQAFDWNNGGSKISSRIAVIQPYRVVVWTGSAFGLKAIHVWKLLPQSNGHVVVRTIESMRGFPASLFYSSADLRQANADWLKALKKQAEAVTRRSDTDE